MKNLLKPLIVTMCRISILLQLMGIVQENGKNGKPLSYSTVNYIFEGVFCQEGGSPSAGLYLILVLF